MPTLEIGIDASRFMTGVQQVEEGSRRIVTVSAQAARNMGNLFAGNAQQITAGVAATAQAMQQFNAAGATFAASRVLMDIGQAHRDFGLLRQQIGSTSTAWGVLGAAFKANPIGLVATGIGLAA